MILSAVYFVKVVDPRIEKLQRLERINHEILLLYEWKLWNAELVFKPGQHPPKYISFSGKSYELEYVPSIVYDVDKKVFVMLEIR